MAGPRPALLTMLIGAAGMTAAMSAVGIASPAAPPTDNSKPTTRLGTNIADDLARQRDKAAGEARALDLREQAVKAAQARLAASVQAAGQQPGAAPAGPTGEPVPDQFDTLAKIYSTMKPAKAAPVFAQLDLEVQYLVAKRMKERATAAILAAMEPASAARLTMALAGKKPVAAKKVLARNP
jgi:flagellar motility protein MotE (MotC chaperone)